MKKLFGILFFVSAMALFMTSCTKSSPGDAFKDYMEANNSGMWWIPEELR